ARVDRCDRDAWQASDLERLALRDTAHPRGAQNGASPCAGECRRSILEMRGAEPQEPREWHEPQRYDRSTAPDTSGLQASDRTEPFRADHLATSPIYHFR
ncbi:MAG: hypothetical protein PV358_17440, partial [Acidimicrobiales bacterium]|nr:hypothetical protein [Acidimicrobiales bacterium]